MYIAHGLSGVPARKSGRAQEMLQCRITSDLKDRSVRRFVRAFTHMDEFPESVPAMPISWNIWSSGALFPIACIAGT